MATWKRDKASGLWRRDIEVIELVRHLDQPERKGEWDRLTVSEIRAIENEIKSCRRDFIYAARNYFMLSTKEGEDVPFSLWESQELILDKWMWLKAKFPTRAQRLMLLKARQLGASTVIEGLIAWSTIFFSNRQGMVVSNTDSHAAYLFGMMQNFYDQLPWFLQPMIASRKIDEGLIFANPKADERRENPGNKSSVVVQSAKQTSGVGQGMRLNAIHLSEYADWDAWKFEEIINGDVIHALSDNINSFAFLESTGKGAGSPGERLWNSQVELAEEAKWFPIFLPWFFEKTRFLAPDHGWSMHQPEIDMREKIKKDWTRCDGCGFYQESFFRGDLRIGVVCPSCNTGNMIPFVLSDGQLRFMQRERVNAEKEGLNAVKKLREELASTAEEAWQLSGIQVFPPECQDFVNKSVCRPILWGSVDEKGRIHYPTRPKDDEDAHWPCGLSDCKRDHRWDHEHPLKIWEMPDRNARYCMGIDVAEGIGMINSKADYSVIWINKFYENGRGPDEQVAIWRSNTVDPIALAGVINYLGRFYNNAIACVEVNKYDACDMHLRMHYLYPNSFVWKHYDSKNPISNKLGWVTNQRTKPMLWQTAIRWLKSRMFLVREEIFAQEMKRFQKDEDDSVRASAEVNFHDDTVIAGMICLFCAHDMDYGEEVEYIPQFSGPSVVEASGFTIKCERCHKNFQAKSPPRKCMYCSSMMISCHRNTNEGLSGDFDIEAELNKDPDFMNDEEAMKLVEREDSLASF